MFKSIRRLLVASTAILVLSAPCAAFATDARMAVVRRAARRGLRSALRFLGRQRRRRRGFSGAMPGSVPPALSCS